MDTNYNQKSFIKAAHLSVPLIGNLISQNSLPYPEDDYITSLDYSQFPEFFWSNLPGNVQKLIQHHLCNSSLPVYILLTPGSSYEKKGYFLSQWMRLRLNNDTENTIDSPSDDIKPPASLSCSHGSTHSLDIDSHELKISLDSQTQLTFRPPAIVEISVRPLNKVSTFLSTDKQIFHPRNEHIASVNSSAVFQPFLWRCGFCVAQYTIVENESLRLIAMHMRLHLELRCCFSCSIILPNSISAIGSQDIRPHRCSELVIPLSNKKAHTSNLLKAKQHGSSSKEKSFIWRRVCLFCNTGFSSPANYQQHLKNVHKNQRFFCPECGGSFSTKGNLTTHIQQVHNLSSSISCPYCSKRLSNRFNMDRHMRQLHPGELGAELNSLKSTVYPNVYANKILNIQTSASVTPQCRSSCDVTIANPSFPSDLQNLSSRGYYLCVNLTEPSSGKNI